MTLVRVIGVGSPAGDDQAGWWAIDALDRLDMPKPLLCPRVSTIALDRPGVGLINHFPGAGCVILIDAVRSGGRPGTIYRLDATALARVDHTLSSHGFGLAAALALARALGTLPPLVIVYGIEIGAAAPESTPTGQVRAAAVAVARQIYRELSPALGQRVLAATAKG